MKLTMMVGAVLLVGAAGCSDDKKEEAAPAPGASASATPDRSMKEVCPEVEAAIPADLMVPTRKQVRQLILSVEEIQDSADLEASNALDVFLDGLNAAEAAFDSGELLPKLDVVREFDGAIVALRDRCEAAGSSAFQ